MFANRSSSTARFSACEIEWEPDPDNVYLTSGTDNLAIHKLPEGQQPGPIQSIHHIGFIVEVQRMSTQLQGESSLTESNWFTPSRPIATGLAPFTLRTRTASLFNCSITLPFQIKRKNSLAVPVGPM